MNRRERISGLLTEKQMERCRKEIDELPILDIKDLYTPENIDNSGSVTVIIGAPRAGKTHMITRDLYKNSRLGELTGCAFSQSIHNEKYSIIRKKLSGFSNFQQDAVLEMIGINVDCKPKPNYYHFTALVDDEDDARNNKVLKNMFTLYRNSNLHTVFATRYVIELSARVRGSMTYLFLGALDSDEDVEKTIEKFMKSVFKGTKLENLYKYMYATENNWFLVRRNDKDRRLMRYRSPK